MKEIETVIKFDLIKAVGKLAGVSQEKTEKVYDALCEYIAQQLEQGNAVSLKNIGRIEPKFMEAKPERERFNHITKQTDHLEAEPPCYRVHFSVYPSIIQRLKESSYETPIT